MIEIYGLDMDELDERMTTEAFALEYFSDYRREKIVRCKNEKAKRQSIAAGYLLDCVLSRHGMREKSAVFHTNPDGKRLLDGADINLSHSGHYVLCAYGTASVGIDVERIRQDNEKVAKRFFVAREYEWLMAQKDHAEAFARLWTLKESYVKKIGTGLRTPLDQFEIRMQPQIGVWKAGGKTRGDCFFREYRREDYCIAVCAGEGAFPEEITFL